jgi:hypothetical protein
MWMAVATALRAAGHGVAVPSLAGREAPYWPSHVARIVEAADDFGDGPVLLVAHSGAGPLLPLAAQALEDRAAACIYADAMLPTNGASRLDTLPADLVRDAFGPAADGIWPAWGAAWPESVWERLIPDAAARRVFRGELAPTPVAIYAEPLPNAPDRACSVYLQFSEGYDAEAEAAHAAGWEVHRLECGHLHMLVEPAAVAAKLAELSRE